MRHQRVAKKFGRSTEHRDLMMRNMVANLILAESIKTTQPKAKEARKLAEKLVTIARKGDLAARRLVASRLTQPKATKKLFDKVVPALEGRKGGYTRILKLGARKGDAAPMVLLQWVFVAQPVEAPKADEAPKAEEAAPAAEAK